MFIKGKSYDKKKEGKKLHLDLLKLRSHLMAYPCLCEVWNIDSIDKDEIQFHVIFCKTFFFVQW